MGNSTENVNKIFASQPRSGSVVIVNVQTSYYRNAKTLPGNCQRYPKLPFFQ